MGTLYDELGCAPTAGATELHRAFRSRARLLHPDLDAGRTPTERARADEAMRRLTEAWAVLGDPAARRRYDAGLGLGGRAADGPAWARPEPEPTFHPGWRFFRPAPWIAVVVILAAIFFGTAYAGSGREPAGRRSSDAGQCLSTQPGFDAVVPCGAPNDGRIVAEVADGSRCPSGSRPHAQPARARVVCLAVGPAPGS